MTKLTERLAKLELEQKDISTILDKIGREIYKIRYKSELDSIYSFDSYELSNYQGYNFVNQEGPKWEKNCPIISIIYYFSRYEEHQVITLPLNWLNQDYKNLEEGRCYIENKIQEENKIEAARQASLKKEEQERKEYARLREKFGG